MGPPRGLPHPARRRAVPARVRHRGRLLQAVHRCAERSRAQAGRLAIPGREVVPRRSRVLRPRRAARGARAVAAGAARAGVRHRPHRLRISQSRVARRWRRHGAVRQGVAGVRHGGLRSPVVTEAGIRVQGVRGGLQRPTRRAPVRVRR